MPINDTLACDCYMTYNGRFISQCGLPDNRNAIMCYTAIAFKMVIIMYIAAITLNPNDVKARTQQLHKGYRSLARR